MVATSYVRQPSAWHVASATEVWTFILYFCSLFIFKMT